MASAFRAHRSLGTVLTSEKGNLHELQNPVPISSGFTNLGNVKSHTNPPLRLNYVPLFHDDATMPSAMPPPNPSLVAIILVVRTRSSRSQLVFHYPPEPLSTKAVPTRRISNHDSVSIDGSSSSDINEETTSSSDDVGPTTRGHGRGSRSEYQSRRSGRGRSDMTDEEDGEGSSPDAATHGSREWQPSWEPLLGLGESSLTALLSPSDRSWHKKKFEVGVNNVCFLGWPVFVRDDGTWQKRKHQGRKHEDEMEETADSVTEDDSVGPLKADRGRENGGAEARSSSKDQSPQQPRPTSEMTMFNVVFVLNPPILEHNLRVKEMYDHVVKKFGRALKWEQGRLDYVWNESKLMLGIKSKHQSSHSPASTLYKDALTRSSLANAIASVFISISASRIASVSLTPSVTFSLQIPPTTSTSILPSLNDPPAQRGLWLTTATDPSRSNSDIDMASSSTTTSSLHLAKHFSLLLLDSPQKILKDVATAGGPLAAPLSTYIQASSPTKSFFKTSTASSISLADIQLLARHLVYWRRAIAIPPLHQRDTYIVSPNADMRQLKSACKAYEAAFPTLRSLPKVLAAISGTPRPWSSLHPSRDHKEAYYSILAWLLRGGWVTQLRTFAFVRVDPVVKRAVDEKDRAEKRPKKEEEAKNDENEDDEITALKRPSIHSRPSSDGRQNDTKDATPNHASLILRPHRASPLESKYLDYIGETLLHTNYSSSSDPTDEEKAELKEYWPAFVKYLNGMEALEKIPVREGLKRKVVGEVLSKLGLDFEHGTDGKQGQILVGVRHW